MEVFSMSKWTSETIGKSIKEFMGQHEITYMPTSLELKENNSGLSRAISLTGGFGYWADKLNLPRKKKVVKWTDELIKVEILKCMDALTIKRMPTAGELKELGRVDLHCVISKYKKYSGWASELGIELSKCETRLGNEYENIVYEKLKNIGYKVERMTTKYAYDLLVEGTVKIDVKVANLYKSRDGVEWWTFHLSKTCPTCDIYICVALIDGKTEKTLVIPSHHVKMKSVNVGKISRYDKYESSYEYIDSYSNFFGSIV